MDQKKLENYLGKEYWHKSMDYHVRIIKIEPLSPNAPEGDYFKDCKLAGYGVYSYVPLKDEVNCWMRAKDLDEQYIEKTPISKVLYGR